MCFAGCLAAMHDFICRQHLHALYACLLSQRWKLQIGGRPKLTCAAAAGLEERHDSSILDKAVLMFLANI